jgi:hypothetical protein
MKATLPGASAGETVAVRTIVWPNSGAAGVTLSVVVVAIEALSKTLKSRRLPVIETGRIINLPFPSGSAVAIDSDYPGNLIDGEGAQLNWAQWQDFAYAG